MKINYIQTLIKEYDISSANISILSENGVISSEMYEMLNGTYKQVRNKTIGKLMLSDPEIKDIIYNGIRKYMVEFIKQNKIKRSDILEIATDAIFMINPPEKAEVYFDDRIIFKNKGIYFSMLEFEAGENLKSKIKVYSMSDGIKVRGGSADENHPGYKSLCQIMNCKRNNKTKDMYNYLKRFNKVMTDSKSTPLINTCSNQWLLEVITEFCNLII